MFNDTPYFAGDGAGSEPSGAPQPNLMTLYLREVRRFGRLQPEDETQLLGQLADGDALAREALICHHLGLVIAMARGFSNRGLDLLDLIEEGNLGMLVALQKFESDRGVRFSTYAGWWIRYYLQTAIATQVPIVRPPLRQQQRAARQAWQWWCDSHGDEAPAPPAHDERLVSAVPLHDDDVEGQIDDAGLHHRDVFDEVAEQRDLPRLASLLRDLVEQLPSRQRDIIVARFGLDGRDECTLQQLSDDRGVTRERIRQVQVEALGALREALEEQGITRDVALQ
ncbi:MAG TPA: sigma-70 family RNA polymerase sigma factor [Albitalea sp.]|nr:sigma-70 family RNA polymerase sigma factor [Albitalea sp.]